MKIASLARKSINVALTPVGFEVSRKRSAEPNLKGWDKTFLEWIEQAAEQGKDPNDVGDVDWSNDPLYAALEKHYLPYITSNSVVLELGPGTGRLSRHVISRCKKMILVDYSQVVCNFLNDYLRGKGNFITHKIDVPAMPDLLSESADAAFANGVFEHLDPEEALWFFEEFHRLLKPGGVVVINYDNIMTREGVEWLKKFREVPGTRCVFRFYHPEMMEQLGRAAGFDIIKTTTDDTRFAYLEMRKSGS